MNKIKGMLLLMVFVVLIGISPKEISSAASKKMTLSAKRITLDKKKSCKVKLKGAKAKKVRWSSSNKKIATVKQGVIKAKKKGRCKIIAKYLGKKYKCTVHVRDNKKTTSTPQVSTPPSESTQKSDTTNPSDKNVELVINSFSKDTMIIVYTITNNTDVIVTMPTYISLEKYDGEDWKAVQRRDTIFKAEAMYILPHDKMEREMGLSTHFVDLSNGEYRLCIETSYGKLYSEFTIA